MPPAECWLESLHPSAAEPAFARPVALEIVAALLVLEAGLAEVQDSALLPTAAASALLALLAMLAVPPAALLWLLAAQA